MGLGLAFQGGSAVAYAGGEWDRRVSGTLVRDEPESKQEERVELGGMV